jgi:nicotinamidase-related amidase
MKEAFMFPHFTPDAAVLLLIDYQVGTLQLSKTNPADIAVRNAITLAKTALAFNMPIILTNSMEDHMQGHTDERLQRVIPDAYKGRIKRAGIVNAWNDPNFKRAVEKTGRRQLIMGAITTDICLVFPASKYPPAEPGALIKEPLKAALPGR